MDNNEGAGCYPRAGWAGALDYLINIYGSRWAVLTCGLPQNPWVGGPTPLWDQPSRSRSSGLSRNGRLGGWRSLRVPLLLFVPLPSLAQMRGREGAVPRHDRKQIRLSMPPSADAFLAVRAPARFRAGAAEFQGRGRAATGNWRFSRLWRVGKASGTAERGPGRPGPRQRGGKWWACSRREQCCIEMPPAPGPDCQQLLTIERL